MLVAVLDSIDIASASDASKSGFYKCRKRIRTMSKLEQLFSTYFLVLVQID